MGDIDSVLQEALDDEEVTTILKVADRGRVTIPKDVRSELGIEDGDRVIVSVAKP